MWDPEQATGSSSLQQISRKDHPGNAATELRFGPGESSLASFNLLAGKQPVGPRTVSHRTLISQVIHKHLDAAIHPGFDPR